MSEQFQILSCQEGKTFTYLLYSADLKRFYGKFFSANDVTNKISAIRNAERTGSEVAYEKVHSILFR